MNQPLPDTPPPSWVEFSHAGLTIRQVPRRQDFGWWAFLLVLTLFWTGMIRTALAVEQLDLAWASMAALVPFLWVLTAILGHRLATRRSLTLTPAGLVIHRTLFARFERIQRLPLRGAEVDVVVHESGKGWTHTAIEIKTSEPGAPSRAVRFKLPGGKNLRDRKQAIEEARWVAQCLRGAIAAAPSGEASGQDLLRQNLTHLLTCIRDPRSSADGPG